MRIDGFRNVFHRLDWLIAPQSSIPHLLLLLVLSVPFLIYGGVVPFHPDNISGWANWLVNNPNSPFGINYTKVDLFDYPPGFLQLHGFAGRIFNGLQIFELQENFAKYVSVGFFINYIFSLLGIYSTYLLSHRFTQSRAFALLAALTLLTAPLWVADSHMLTVDVPGAAMCVLAVLLTLKFHDDGQLKHLILSSIVCGCAAAIKYPIRACRLGTAFRHICRNKLCNNKDFSVCSGGPIQLRHIRRPLYSHSVQF